MHAEYECTALFLRGVSQAFCFFFFFRFYSWDAVKRQTTTEWHKSFGLLSVCTHLQSQNGVFVFSLSFSPWCINLLTFTDGSSTTCPATGIETRLHEKKRFSTDLLSIQIERVPMNLQVPAWTTAKVEISIRRNESKQTLNTIGILSTFSGICYRAMAQSVNHFRWAIIKLNEIALKPEN